MKNSYYEVDKIETKLINYDISDTSQNVRIYFTSRFYDYKFDTMPKALQTIIPVQHDNEPGYDHISEEIRIHEEARQQQILPVHQQPPAPITAEEKLQSYYMDLLDDHLKENGDAAEMLRKLNTAILNLTNAATFDQTAINKAKAIINGINTQLKVKNLTLQMLFDAKKMLGISENINKNKPHSKDGKTDHDNKKD